MAQLSQGLENYKAGQTGLLRLTWDNGDRTVLVNPELGGITLGWNLTHTAEGRIVRGHRRHRLPHPNYSRALESMECAWIASSMAAASLRKTPP